MSNKQTMTELNVDPSRDGGIETGILVRARCGDKWGAYDIAALDRASLLAWLRSRGGENSWAEDTVCLLLGHETPFTTGNQE